MKIFNQEKANVGVETTPLGQKLFSKWESGNWAREREGKMGRERRQDGERESVRHNNFTPTLSPMQGR